MYCAACSCHSSFHLFLSVSANACIRKRKRTGAMQSPCLAPVVAVWDVSFLITELQVEFEVIVKLTYDTNEGIWCSISC